MVTRSSVITGRVKRKEKAHLNGLTNRSTRVPGLIVSKLC